MSTSGRWRRSTANSSRRSVGEALAPAVVEEIVAAASEIFNAAQQPAQHANIARELAVVAREQQRLADAIAATADSPTLGERLKRARSAAPRPLRHAWTGPQRRSAG